MIFARFSPSRVESAGNPLFHLSLMESTYLSSAEISANQRQAQTVVGISSPGRSKYPANSLIRRCLSGLSRSSLLILANKGEYLAWRRRNERTAYPNFESDKATIMSMEKVIVRDDKERRKESSNFGEIFDSTRDSDII